MSTFSYESDLKLIGCGIDGETVSRFLPHITELAPLPMVFTPREVEYIKELPDPVLGFCSAFCCKEAVVKALGQPVNFVECELLYIPGQTLQRPLLSLSRDSLPQISDCTVRFFFDQPDELVAVVHLFGEQ